MNRIVFFFLMEEVCLIHSELKLAKLAHVRRIEALQLRARGHVSARAVSQNVGPCDQRRRWAWPALYMRPHHTPLPSLSITPRLHLHLFFISSLHTSCSFLFYFSLHLHVRKEELNTLHTISMAEKVIMVRSLSLSLFLCVVSIDLFCSKDLCVLCLTDSFGVCCLL